MVHTGRERGVAQGPLLVDPSADPKKESDRVLLGQARILGGGTSNMTRSGPGDKPEHKDVVVSARIAAAVNKRFHSYQKGIQVGMAKAHTDGWIELAVHPRYKDNLDRYMQVVRRWPFRRRLRNGCSELSTWRGSCSHGNGRPGGRAIGGHRPEGVELC